MKLTFKNTSDVCGNFFKYLTMFLFIVFSNDTLIVGTNSNPYCQKFMQVLPLILLSVTLIYYLSHGFFHIDISILLVAMVLVLLQILTLIFAPGENTINNVMYTVLLILSGALIANVVSFIDIAFLLEKVVFMLAVCSLVLFAAAWVFPSFVMSFPIITNVGENEFYNMGFSMIPAYGMIDSHYLRNFGIFREPGVFQMYLNFALAIYLFLVKEKKHVLHIAVYLIAILSTTSTTALLASAVLILTALLQNDTHDKKLKLWILILALFTLSFLLFGHSENLLFAIKKLSDKSNASFISRLGSIYANIDIALRYPLFGIGPAEILTEFPKIVMEYSDVSHFLETPHNTNTILYSFACYGIITGSLITLGISRMICLFSSKKTVQLFMLLFLFILLAGENLMFAHNFYILFMIGYRCKHSGISSTQ